MSLFRNDLGHKAPSQMKILCNYYYTSWVAYFTYVAEHSITVYLYVLNISVYWRIMPCSRQKSTDILEKHIASIFKVEK
jgi:hypothetical protein